MIVQIDAI